jgi:hypothetical protein
VDEEFEYYFDATIVPGLGVVPSNQIPLNLQPDAEYHIRGVQVSGNVGNLLVRFWKNGTQLSQTLVPVDRAYSSSVQGASPVGKLPVPLEGEVLCEPGSQLLVDLALL